MEAYHRTARALAAPRLAAVALAALAPLSPAAAAAGHATPARINPGYHHPDLEGFHAGATHDAILRAARAGTLQTLPSWSHAFSINGTSYNYTLLGTDPALGATTTTIPTILVPVRLTVPDVQVNGKSLVLDATKIMPSVIASPIFTPAAFDSGILQFGDAMLHAEFPQAPADWHLLLTPTIAATLDITAPSGSVTAMQSKTGKYLGIIQDDTILDDAINKSVRKNFPPTSYVIYVTYNALEHDAFGYHSAHVGNNGTTAIVYAYNSWLVGVDDLLSLASPNADTFGHETAETIHDALGLSKTLLWGDWFNKNRCFQDYIEVGDAVEDAPGNVQNYNQKVTINGKSESYTLQTEALLPWFERQYPSTAIHGAYSWPGEVAILGPAPFTCGK
jgi:hypothetical protein